MNASQARLHPPHKIKRKKVKYMTNTEVSSPTSPHLPDMSSDDCPSAPSPSLNIAEIKILVTSPSQTSPHSNQSENNYPPNMLSPFTFNQRSSTDFGGQKLLLKMSPPSIAIDVIENYTRPASTDDKERSQISKITPTPPGRFGNISVQYDLPSGGLGIQHIRVPETGNHKGTVEQPHKLARMLKGWRLFRTPRQNPIPGSSMRALFRTNDDISSRMKGSNKSGSSLPTSTSNSGIRSALLKTHEFVNAGLHRKKSGSSIKKTLAGLASSRRPSLSSNPSKLNLERGNADVVSSPSTTVSLSSCSPATSCTAVNENDSVSDGTVITDTDLSEEDVLMIWNERRVRSIGSTAIPITWEGPPDLAHCSYNEVIDVFDGLLDDQEICDESDSYFGWFKPLRDLELQVENSWIMNEPPVWDTEGSIASFSTKSDSWGSIEFQRLKSPSSKILSLLAAEQSPLLKHEIPPFISPITDYDNAIVML